MDIKYKKKYVFLIIIPAILLILVLVPSVPNVVPDFKIVGYISYFQIDKKDNVNLKNLSHLIWQSVQITGPDDMTLVFPKEHPESELTALGDLGHAYGVKVLASLANHWEATINNQVFDSSDLRANLVINLLDFVNTHQLDGIDIDWESEDDPSFNVDSFSTFLVELRKALGNQKIIMIAGNPYNVSINAAGCAVVDAINLMTYDMYKGVGFPYHSTLSESIAALELWAEAGIPKEKILLGIPLYGRDAATGYYSWRHIVNTYHPSEDQNETAASVPGGLIWWNGVSLVKQKVTFVKNERYGGVMLYEVGIDDYSSGNSMLDIVHDLINP